MAKQSYSRCHQQKVSYVQKVRKNGPGYISNTSIGGLSQIEQLKKDLSMKKNIVIISRAGISTNAGGSLRSNVLLYGEYNPEELEILAAFNNNLHQPVDAVIIIGIRLGVGSLGGFMEKLYEKARPGNKKCLTV
ncbi:hypothetical protein CC78DRAFT_549438 [Lojkania enalia]|uniref:Uncharacterized protein n=1 Tax=Lojkania enalia TaxID=147567 RepID=A0A9P4N0U6_9PLEO|nr:hypothetical protein CC78DRAFT_549438 [Didymosphaeria enalia]